MTDTADRIRDLLVVGSGPTGISIAAEASSADLDVLMVDKGPLLASLLRFPRDMVFFTTRERLEIAGIPFSIPDPKPTRRQAVTYYHSVVRAYDLDLALHREVDTIDLQKNVFHVGTSSSGARETYRARAVALATGYFDHPRHLGVTGEEQPWVHHLYDEPYRHFGERVVVVGGGNSAAEAALELWRGGARVTLVHRGAELKPSVKYWLKPDVENRVAEGSIEALWTTRVTGFGDRQVKVTQGGQQTTLPVDAAYVLIGYEPDVQLQRRAGVEVDPVTLVPSHDPATCESNVAGLYIAGTLQAGRDTNRIFIENSRYHSQRIVEHLLDRLG